jgi:hypothetical protein
MPTHARKSLLLVRLPQVCSHLRCLPPPHRSPGVNVGTGSSGGGRCYTGGHWVLVVVTGLAVAALFIGAARALPPRHVAVGFGLPFFPLGAVPLRLALAWSGRFLVVLSPCGAALLALLCNIGT